MRSRLLKILHPDLDHNDAARPTAVERLVDRLRRSSKGVRIQGADGLMVRYAQCCQPVPGDPVVGYVTRGRGVSIHRGDCPNLLVSGARARASTGDRLAGDGGGALHGSPHA